MFEVVRSCVKRFDCKTNFNQEKSLLIAYCNFSSLFKTLVGAERASSRNSKRPGRDQEKKNKILIFLIVKPSIFKKKNSKCFLTCSASLTLSLLGQQVNENSPLG